MKRIIFFSLIGFLMAFSRLHAQQSDLQLPSYTLIPHYVLSIGYNTTTVLIFSSPVKPVDRGDRDVLAQKQPGVENVLKLKAARRNFQETNLHVFTADGKIYAFDILYTDSLGSTHDLTNLARPLSTETTTPVALLTGKPVNAAQMDHYVRAMKDLRVSHHGPIDRSNQMTIRLDRVGLAGPLLLFRIHIANHSHLDYNLDFVRLYIRDSQKAKRTSVQEREIIPVYEDSLGIIAGDSSITHILAIPAFSLANGKQFVLEAYEKNGGRNLTLYIKNKTLFKAKKL